MTAFARALPRLAARIPIVPLGDWPTPVRELQIHGRSIWVKDEGASSALYGGNKVRTLEPWFGHARERGAKRIWAIGAYGSNHAIATVLHAPRAGLEGAAILFPQPGSEWAKENAGALIASGCPLVRLHSVVEVPFAALWIARREPDSVVMPPGGATTIGTFGALAAAFELGEQIDAGELPAPRRIVLPAGSTCTAAGLLAGVHLARAAGVWRWPLPIIHAVRVTPWPVTAPFRIAGLARKTLARARALGGPQLGAESRDVGANLVVDGREYGRGYGKRTARGDAATDAIAQLANAPRLDGVYSAKAAAALLRLHDEPESAGPLLFWSSKSAPLLAGPEPDALVRAPRALQKFVARRRV